jgi:hypothetical protein
MHPNISRLSKLSLAIFLITNLSACGGGGSDTSSAASTPSPLLTSSNYASVATSLKNSFKYETDNYDAYHYLPSGSKTYVNSIMRLAYVSAGLITTTGTANDASGSVSAASIAGYLIGQYAGTAASTVTNGSTQIKTYTCGSGNISESVTDTSGNGFSAVGMGDFSVITFNNCVYGAINANGSIGLTALSVTGTPDVDNVQAILQARADYNNLVANSTGTYKINGSKTVTIDTLNHVLSDQTDYSNYYSYKSVNGNAEESTEESTTNGTSLFVSNGSTYTWSANQSSSDTANGASMQLTVDTIPPMSGTVSFPSNGAWTINAPSSGAVAYTMNNQKLTLTTTGSGQFLTTVDLDNNGTTDASTTIYW